LLDALLEYTVHGNMPPVLEERRSSVTHLDSSRVSVGRREGYILISATVHIFVDCTIAFDINFF